MTAPSCMTMSILMWPTQFKINWMLWHGRCSEHPAYSPHLHYVIFVPLDC